MRAVAKLSPHPLVKLSLSSVEEKHTGSQGDSPITGSPKLNLTLQFTVCQRWIASFTEQRVKLKNRFYLHLVDGIILSMSDALQKLIFLLIMLVVPPSLFGLVNPALSSIQITAPELAYLPSIIGIILLMILVADAIGIFMLGAEWWYDIVG